MREPTELEIKRFKKAAENLAALGRKGFYIYLAEDCLHLMTGPSHKEIRGKDSLDTSPNQEAIRATVRIPRAGGGDW